MTIDEAIKELKHDYNELGKGIPCDTGWGILFDKAYTMAIEVLEKSKWKSVKDELPKNEMEVLVKLAHTYADDRYIEYGIAKYFELEEGSYWCENKYGFLEWDKYSDGNGGCSLYKVVEWKEI